ncbi:MAG: hypothetical protein VYC34_06425, partial [Planctomycetota bacterium]|nr:hypothetical protein [Planctomycetota bacterium]
MTINASRRLRIAIACALPTLAAAPALADQDAQPILRPDRVVSLEDLGDGTWRIGVNVQILDQNNRVDASFERGTCPEEQVQNYTDTGTFFAIPGFNQGEQLGAVLDAPASHYPIEV